MTRPNGTVWRSQDISRRDAAWGLTTDTLDEAHADAQARKPDGFTYIDHGTLHRIAASLEAIERMLVDNPARALAHSPVAAVREGQEAAATAT